MKILTKILPRNCDWLNKHDNSEVKLCHRNSQWGSGRKVCFIDQMITVWNIVVSFLQIISFKIYAKVSFVCYVLPMGTWSNDIPMIAIIHYLHFLIKCRIIFWDNMCYIFTTLTQIPIGYTFTYHCYPSTKNVMVYNCRTRSFSPEVFVPTLTHLTSTLRMSSWTPLSMRTWRDLSDPSRPVWIMKWERVERRSGNFEKLKFFFSLGGDGRTTSNDCRRILMTSHWWLEHDCSNSSALAMELLQACTKLSIDLWQGVGTL